MLKTNFKKLAIEPLVGYGSDAIYLSQLGIKTNSNGEYYLDEAIFEKTLSNNPDYFLALKDANLSSNSTSAILTKNAITDIPPGTYTVRKDGADWKFGDTLLSTDGNGYFSSMEYPGFVINTAEANPAQFDVYVGKSFAQKMIDLMTDTLDLNSSLRSAEDSYKSLTEDIEARLEKLDEREKLISSRYTEQFGAMEQAMTQFNSTKSMLENFIESWKKQK
jgi:flagellar hook-associated protein 2